MQKKFVGRERELQRFAQILESEATQTCTGGVRFGG